MKRILLSIAAVLAMVGIIACGAGSKGAGDKAIGTTASPSAAAAAKYADPVAADFTMSGKITSKQCFDSAGCNIELVPQITYTGAGAKPNSVWDVTFDVIGSEDAITQTLTITFDATGKTGTYTQDSIFASTKKQSDALSFKITSITAG